MRKGSYTVYCFNVDCHGAVSRQIRSLLPNMYTTVPSIKQELKHIWRDISSFRLATDASFNDPDGRFILLDWLEFTCSGEAAILNQGIYHPRALDAFPGIVF